MVRYLFCTIGDLTYQSPLVPLVKNETREARKVMGGCFQLEV